MKSDKPENPPAFSTQKLNPLSKNGYGQVMQYDLTTVGGMTLLDYFAAKAMQAYEQRSFFMNNEELECIKSAAKVRACDTLGEYKAKEAYDAAECLLKERLRRSGV